MPVFDETKVARGGVLPNGTAHSALFAEKGQSSPVANVVQPNPPFNEDRHIKGWLGGSADDLNNGQKNALAHLAGVLHDFDTPEIDIHDENEIIALYTDINDWDNENTFRLTLDRNGLVTGFGSGTYWTDDDEYDEQYGGYDHRAYALVRAAGLAAE
ncbi:hypothetical protein [Leifsonia sp. Leaf264]|uniref:hypothetical protein n=1 Tax=Leifsonia sp. Leaf264 TaxID=1736314 RepID=UPI0006F693AE|nr:hypothetical protein [Leifsonia sp. Leaf264]KQO98713.1 hypothetical protein ASF30_11665 [Leifsonia sp. Leaf264]